MIQTIDISGSHPENISRPRKPGDVGYDLATSREATVFVGRYTHVATGVRLGMPPGIWAEIVGRSSTLVNSGLLVVHSIIDQGYTGELTIGLINLGTQMQIVPPGQRIAQLIFREAVLPRLQLTMDLPRTERGDTGFGSTGT